MRTARMVARVGRVEAVCSNVSSWHRFSAKDIRQNAFVCIVDMFLSNMLLIGRPSPHFSRSGGLSKYSKEVFDELLDRRYATAFWGLPVTIRNTGDSGAGILVQPFYTHERRAAPDNCRRSKRRTIMSRLLKATASATGRATCPGYGLHHRKGPRAQATASTKGTA